MPAEGHHFVARFPEPLWVRMQDARGAESMNAFVVRVVELYLDFESEQEKEAGK